mgnify:CR=1 FL=1
MPYDFLYDISRLPRSFFKELVRVAYNSGLHRKAGTVARSLVSMFRIEKITGLNVNNAISLIEDLIDIESANLLFKDDFKNAKRKVLLLPHCARKYMDSRCKAYFDPSIPSYFCNKCSEDCLINKASQIGYELGYDVYVIPGGSCVEKILRRGYDAVVGVACGMELKLGLQIIRKLGIPGQGLFLLKNGCANTKFDIEQLKRILEGGEKFRGKIGVRSPVD